VIEASDFKRELKALFNAQPLAVLATQSDEGPYANLVAFTAADDLGRLFFATARSTRKYANLSKRPEASLLVDNRSNRLVDFRDAVAVTAVGSVEETKREEWADLYLFKHPYMSDFVRSPSTALLALKVRRYVMVSKFQNVVEVDLDEGHSSSGRENRR